MILNLMKIVIDGEFFIFNEMDEKLIEEEGYNRIDRWIEIRVLMFKKWEGKYDLGMLMIGNEVKNYVFE